MLLTLSDEKDLVNNEMLNDRHINVAQRLLNIQFPDIEGLGHTLLQSRPPQPKPKAYQMAYKLCLFEEIIGLYPAALLTLYRLMTHYILQLVKIP